MSFKVMDKLRTLFQGYSAMPPTMFVFCGNFVSEAFGAKHSRILRGKTCYIYNVRHTYFMQSQVLYIFIA